MLKLGFNTVVGWNISHILRRVALSDSAYLLPGVDLVACVIKAWLLLTVVCVLVAGWRFSPMLTVRTWFTGPWRDRGQTSTHQCPQDWRHTAGPSQCRKLCCAFTNRSAEILLFLLIFSLTGPAFKVKGVSAASLRSSKCLSGWALTQDDGWDPPEFPLP